jgi:ankyrin repeat protein
MMMMMLPMNLCYMTRNRPISVQNYFRHRNTIESDQTSWSDAHEAVVKRDLEKLMKCSSDDLVFKDSFGQTALWWACHEGALSEVEWLVLTQKQDIFQKDDDGVTCVEALLNGGNIHYGYMTDFWVQHIAPTLEKDPELKKRLLRAAKHKNSIVNAHTNYLIQNRRSFIPLLDCSRRQKILIK